MTFTDGDLWRDVPNAILDQDRRQREAEEWAAQQRAALAQDWADVQRAELAQQFPDLSRIGSWAGDAGSETTTPPTPTMSSPVASSLSPAPASTPSLTDFDAVPVGSVTSKSRGPINDVSQFGQAGLTYDEALAACGPAAAVRLASIFGNNIPLKAALDAAKQVGWTSAGGMNGVQNQKRLLDNLGIPATLDYAPDLSKVISDAQSGNPVTVSTPRHYYTIDGYDPETGRFHVGQSGLAFKGGSQWMTWSQIRSQGNGINGALFVDAPTSPQPSVAAMETGQTQRYEGGGSPVAAPIGFDGMIRQAQEAIAGVVQPAGEAIQGAVETVQALPQQAQQSFEDIVNQARAATGYQEQPVQTPGFGFDPTSMRPATAPGEGVPLRQDVRDLGQQPQPTLQENVWRGLTEPQPFLNTLVQGQTKKMGGETLTPEQNYAMARGMATGLVQAFGPEELMARATTTGAGSLAKSAGVAQDIATSRLPAEAEAGFAAGLPTGGLAAEEAVQRVARLTPQEIAAAIDKTGTHPLQTDFLYTVQPAYRGGAVQPGRGVQMGGEPVVWLTADAPLGGRTGIALAIDKAKLDPSLLSQAPNGYPVYKGQVPADAVINLGEVGPGKDIRGVNDLLARFQSAVQQGVTSVTSHGLTINLPKYVPEEVQQVIQRAYDANPAIMDEARRGVIGDDVVRELANQVGRTPAQIAALWKPGQAKNAETILALREGLNSASQDVLRAQQALRAAPDSADALNAVTEALTRHAAIQETVTGVTAEAGRALRQFRQPVTGQQFAVQQLQRLAKATKMEPEELARHLADVDLTDPTKVANIARNLTQHSFGDKLTALWYFSLLSSPVTHIKNTVSNAIVLGSRPLESLASATVDVGRAAITRSSRERYFGEVPAQLVGMRAALTDGVRSAYQILRRGYSEAEATLKPELATAEPFRGRLADLTVNVPGRALRASDVFFRTLNKTASLYADAYRMASREGLKGEGLFDEVARLIGNPTKEMLERAEREGAYRVFQQDGTFVQQMGQLRNNVPALRFLVPFIQTPYNIAKYALERSPLGAVKLASETITPAGRAALRAKGAGDFSDRVARAALGSATLWALTEYARQGNLTGAAPIDQADRDAFFRQGKQAYSMRNPITGEWFSYAGLQPFTTIFAAAAEIEKMQRAEPGKPPPDLLTGVAVTSLALGRATLDQPWTDGLAEFLDFLSGANVRDSQDMMDAAGKYAARQSRVVVPAVLRWLSTATDTSIREPERGLPGVPQTILSGIPGLQGAAPEKLTAFGEPAPRPVTGAQTLNPFAASQPTNDPVEQELARLDLRGFDVQPGYVGKTITVGTEQVELETPERRRYQQVSGMLAYELLANAVSSSEWQALSDVGKAKAVDRLVSRARDVARAQLGAEPAVRERAIETRQRRLAGAAR